MTFSSTEISNYDGQPVDLYEFSVGTNTWRYCSGPDDFILGGNTYVSTQIANENTTQSSDATADDFTVSMRADSDFAELFRGTAPSSEIWLTMRRAHVGDTEAPIHWVGTVTTVKQVGFSHIKVIGHLQTASFKRSGLRMTWGRQCQNALYDHNCRANKAAFGLTIEIDALTGDTIVSSDLALKPVGWFTGGFIECRILSGVIERRAVNLHGTSTSINLLSATDGLAVGDLITVYAGCNLSSAQCLDKFNNLSNYGGIPHLPGKSPFDGDPVF